MPSFLSQSQAILDLLWTILRSDDSVEAARELYLKFSPFAGPKESLASIEDRTIPGPHGAIPIRIYRPNWESNNACAMYFHGGWFCLGDLETHDTTVRSLANAAQCILVAVDYRRAPEFKFPIAPDEAYAATCWVYAHAEELGIEKSRFAVVGDSVGGNLATVTARRARDHGGPPLVSQALIYPVTCANLETESWQTFAHGPLFTRGNARHSWNMYLGEMQDRSLADVSPLQCQDLGDLPPTLVLSAEMDGLRDEAELYARALDLAGVPVQLTRYEGIVHGFFQMAGILPHGRRAIKQVAEHLNLYFYGHYGLVVGTAELSGRTASRTKV